jgi:putative peptide zinc metalloprotease protein
MSRFTSASVGKQENVMRKLLGGLVAALIAVAVCGPATPARAVDNSAEAVNTKDGKSVFKLAFSVKKTMDNDVEATNSAVAYASCEDCKTVAAAIQVVLVANEPTSVDAENVAVAINYDCTECQTLAAAYQFVFGTGEEMQFTPEGKRRLNELKQQFKALKHQDGLTLQQLSSAIAVIAGEVAKVVDTELVAEEKDKDVSATTSTTATSTTSTTDGSSGIGPTTTADEPTSTTAP